MKILVIRFSSIGDIVLTSPVVRGLKTQLGAEVHFLTKRSFAAVVSSNPHIDRVIPIEKDVSEVKAELQQAGYDAVIDLHQNLRSWRVRSWLWRTPSRGFDKLNREKWLLVRWKINRMPAIHIVDRYWQTAAFLGVKPDTGGLDYFIPEDQEVDMPTFWQQHSPHPYTPPYVTFVTGAAHATKRLPPEKIIALCQQIPFSVILLGGPDEAQSGDAIAAAAGTHVLNACGKLSLHQSASVVKNAQHVITHDTGLMHIAAAFKKNCSVIWGNTVPALGMYPYRSPHTNYEVADLPCRPCSKIGFQSCPKGHFACMENQNLSNIPNRLLTFGQQ